MPRRNAKSRHKLERLRNLQFEGISIRPGDPVADARQAVTAVRKILSAEHLDWRIQPYGKRARSVFVVPPPGSPQLSPAKAWELTYRLRARRDVAHAEPAFVLPSVGPYHAPGRHGAVGGTAPDLPGSADISATYLKPGTERDLPAKLAAFADELAFHLAADPETYAATHAALAGRRGAVAVRPATLLRRASPSLKRQLA